MKTKFIFVVCALLITCIFFGFYYQFATSTFEITGSIQKKYVETYGETTLYYIVLSTGEKLECDTNIFLHDSSPESIYNGVNVNQSYVFTCWGWHDSAWEPNILNATMV